MPVEIRTADGRHWARQAHQLHAPLPYDRLVTDRDRWRARRREAALFLLVLAAGLLVGSASFPGTPPRPSHSHLKGL
jgi:hypothetical protein